MSENLEENTPVEETPEESTFDMSKEFSKDDLTALTNKELKDVLSSRFGRTDVPIAKKPTNPSKDDLVYFLLTLQNLEKEEASKPKADVVEVPSISDLIKPVRASVYNKLSLAEKKEIKDKMIRVVVHKNPISQSLSSSKGVVEFFPWVSASGQKRIAKVAYGTPWHVPRQVLMNLMQAKASTFVQQGNNVIEEHDTQALYSIEILPALTIEAMKDLAETQKLRKK